MAEMGSVLRDEGNAGEPPDLPSAIRLKELYEEWLGAAQQEEQSTIWHDAADLGRRGVLDRHRRGVLQPVVVNDKLRNVPEEGIYNWDPGAFFGIYKPDGSGLTRPNPGEIGIRRPATRCR